MEITDKDRLFYSSAVERLTERFEIAREFVRNNGLPSMPMEELTTMMIIGIKEWVEGEEGEEWLSTLGYSKANQITVSGTIHFTISGCTCPSCSGAFSDIHGMYCERCGKYVCSPCMTIVDPIYQIGWCDDCLKKQPLTNQLVYSE